MKKKQHIVVDIDNYYNQRGQEGGREGGREGERKRVSERERERERWCRSFFPSLTCPYQLWE